MTPREWRLGNPHFASAVSLAVLLGLGGCATPSTISSDPSNLSGRLAVRVAAHDDSPARSVSALFDLRRNGPSGELDLSTPLGTLMGKAQWGPEQVSLITPQGERQYPTLNALSEDVLGESIPVQALFDWLLGRPWSGAVSTPLPGDLHTGFTQLGWRIQLDRFTEGVIQAQRDAPPVVIVHARLLR